MTTEKTPRMPALFYTGTPMHRWQKIMREGLVPSSESRPGETPVVYLTDEREMAEHYAGMNFGEDEPQPWAILEIDTKTMDASLLLADNGHEATLNADDIVARGYTIDQIWSGDFPWWVSLEETGQVMYAGPIAVGAIRLVGEVGQTLQGR